MNRMKLTKRVQLKPTRLLEALCAKSRNLYNVANWYVRHDFFILGNRLFYSDLYAMLKNHKNYVELQAFAGAHAPQQVLLQVDRVWESFYAAMKEYRKEPAKFRGRPRPPGYKRRGDGNVVQFTKQQTRVRDGFIRLPEKPMKQGMPVIKTTFNSKEVVGVRIVPSGDRYNYEIIHEVEERDLGLDKGKSIGIDIGLINTATTSDRLIVKGGAIMSINQFYNKSLARMRTIAKKINGKDNTKAIAKLNRIRNNKIREKIHYASKRIVGHCIKTGIGTIFIGYNPGWKQDIDLGKRNDQNFVYVPLLKFVKQVEYKAALVGITVHRITEEYTSQTCSRCSQRRKANRVHRGLYTCRRCGLIINADVNAARNIKNKGLREVQLVLEAAGREADRGDMNSPPEISTLI